MKKRVPALVLALALALTVPAWVKLKYIIPGI